MDTRTHDWVLDLEKTKVKLKKNTSSENRELKPFPQEPFRAKLLTNLMRQDDDDDDNDEDDVVFAKFTWTQMNSNGCFLFKEASQPFNKSNQNMASTQSRRG